MIELEKTFLAKYLPEELAKKKCEEIIDIYIPKAAGHPTLRIRKKGDKCEMTKKEPVKRKDVSRQKELTIALTKEEFLELSKVEGKKVRKIRYYFSYEGKKAEFDVFQDGLLGLVLIDFEFKSTKEKSLFSAPDFCLADVTQEEFIAGGMICGKKYEDLKGDLKKFEYKKLLLG